MAHRFVQRSQVETSKVGDRVVLFDQRMGRALVLNPTGALVWNALIEPRSPAELASVLTEAFPSIAEAQAAKDVMTYIEQLLSEGLVEPKT